MLISLFYHVLIPAVMARLSTALGRVIRRRRAYRHPAASYGPAAAKRPPIRAAPPL